MYISRIANNWLTSLLDGPKAVFILGARQVGKTTLVQHVLTGRSALFLNFDIEVDRARFLAMSTLPPPQAKLLLGSPDVLVLDEAQRLPETGRIVKDWLNSGLAMKVLLLGSSSLNLLDQSAESLTGRNRKLRLPPLVLEEMLTTQTWYHPDLPRKVLLDVHAPSLRTCLLTAMAFGGYPEVATAADKVGLLRELSADYLWKDVLMAGVVRHPETLRRLIQLLAHQAGSVVSVNELAQNLQVARATVDRHLDLLEQTFVIFRLPSFSTNPRNEIAKSRKAFFWDTGIRNALINNFDPSGLRPDIGRLWENWVVAEVAKWNLLTGSQSELFFWRNRAQAEVDLVLRHADGSLTAFDAKWGRKATHARAFASAHGAEVKPITPDNPLLGRLLDAREAAQAEA